MMDNVKQVTQYKELLGKEVNYFELNQTEKYWYLHLKKSRKNSFKDIVFPHLEVGIRVWLEGCLYELIDRDGWDLTFVMLNGETKERLADSTMTVDEIEEVNYTDKIVKRKKRFVLDDPTNEELTKLHTVFDNEGKAQRSERTKGASSLEFKEGTIGEKVKDVVHRYNGSYMNMLLKMVTVGLTHPSEDEVIRVVFKSRKEGIEIAWDEFPRDKRQDFINLPLLGNVESVNDYFETRYIYMKTSLKDYVPLKEEDSNGDKTVL